MRIIAVSDLHGNLPGREPLKHLAMPDGDLLCICGDIVPLDIQRDYLLSEIWFNSEFLDWTNSLPYKKIIVIPGNHDFYLYRLFRKGKTPEFISSEKNTRVELLIDSLTEYEGLTIYGTPWCPDLTEWAFYKDSESLTKTFNRIPDCDILMIPCPPSSGHQGIVLQGGYNHLKDFSCEELAEAVLEKNITWVLSGHVHSGAHYEEVIENSSGKAIRMRNVSLLDEDYNIAYGPFVLEINKQ